MATETVDGSVARANFKHFLVERNGSYFLVTEVERYRNGDPDYDQVAALFESGYQERPVRATPLRKKDLDLATEGNQQMMAASQLGGGAITLRFEPGEN